MFIPKGFKLELEENLLKQVDHNKPALKKQKTNVKFHFKKFFIFFYFLIINYLIIIA